jgi:hypothetical protein
VAPPAAPGPLQTAQLARARPQILLGSFTDRSLESLLDW